MSLSAASFEYLRSLLREHSGNLLADDKAYLVEARLAPLARRRGLDTLEELVARLRSGQAPDLRQQVLEALTINETSFFRDDYPWRDLRESALPELIRRRGSERRLHVWSAACASGQEAYSLALLLLDSFPETAGWSVRLLASDLSHAMLLRARRGWYSDLEVSRGVPPELLTRFFRRAHGGWQVAEPVRRTVEFLPLNLIDPWPALPPFDLVLLRNVLIYLDVPTRQHILARVRRVLRPDGYLLLGGAETTHGVDEAFELVPLGGTTFHRPRGPGAG